MSTSRTPSAGVAAAPSVPDWSAVSRVRIRVRQQYRYAYPVAATALRQRLVMLPPEQHGDQRAVVAALHVQGADTAHVSEEHDAFGNRVHQVLAPRVPEAVDFAADFTVERTAPGAPPRLPVDVPRAAFLAPTALTAPSPAIQAAAREIAARATAGEGDVADVHAHVARLERPARRQWAAATLACRWAAGAIAYQLGVTGVRTPAAMALALGSGVCQDYAHLALAVLRELRIASRYVSGHLLGEGAPHAWVEALLPDGEQPGALRALAFDPTHCRATRLDYVTVATGRDYADVASTSGTFTGQLGRFTATKDAWLVEVA